MATLRNDILHNPANLETVDDRLHALRQVARTHEVSAEELPGRRDALADKLAGLDDGERDLQSLRKTAQAAYQAYRDCALALSQERRDAAKHLEAAVMDELPDLKLQDARIETRFEALAEEKWSAQGAETVAFTVATNPGIPLAPLDRVASGGELSRFMLALKVVSAAVDGTLTLVFDEVDSGIGGAVAAAVGQRLARLGETRQVLVVTHSPQVAARGNNHWRISKQKHRQRALSGIQILIGDDRRDEIARMLSANEVTPEARAAAERLLHPGNTP